MICRIDGCVGDCQDCIDLSSVKAIQADIAEWHREHFPTATPEQVGLLIAEEAGEVCRAILKNGQGLRPAVNWVDEIESELGDLFISLCGLATIHGLDLQASILKRWKHVRARNPRDRKE